MSVPTIRDIYEQRKIEYSSIQYQLCHFLEWDYTILNRIMYINTKGKSKHRTTVNNVIIMADTETSKKPDSNENHVVAWSVAIRAYNHNIVTLWGQKPSDLCICIDKIINNMEGNNTHIYFHNLSYDWMFIRKFCFKCWGYPVRMLNTKPHYPINIEFENGVVFRDSYILAQRKLEKWAEDLHVTQKAVGKWEYKKIRNQNDVLSTDELEYIECDVVAGVECIDATLQNLNKDISTISYTATGVPREQTYKLARANRGREEFLQQCMSYDDYIFSESVYHGGFVHSNRNQIGHINRAICYDFISSYPFCMLAFKYPMERFTFMGTMSPETIIKLSDKYAFMFTLILVQPDLKDKHIVMPALQFSKCITTINAIQDNGRIMFAEYASINITEQDLIVLLKQYKYKEIYCINVRAARKDYLPRWYTDYVYQCFKEKTMLKGGDPVAYSIAKAKVNSLYGMMVQKSIKENIVEDYATGEYSIAECVPEELYEKYINNNKSVLCYQWGIWVTAYAFNNIFQLSECIADDGIWLYTDTDSAYATSWNRDKITAYNNHCKELLLANGYDAVVKDGKEYWLGLADFDGEYSEFVSMGAKRYACRDAVTGELKITVAGVPKKTGAKCLHDDINNFKKGLVFDGVTTGKLEHKHIYVDNIYIDKWGNETGDSIDLSPCDYLLDSVYTVDWEKIDRQEIVYQVYD